jgi:hypothetical protein
MPILYLFCSVFIVSGLCWCIDQHLTMAARRKAYSLLLLETLYLPAMPVQMRRTIYRKYVLHGTGYTIIKRYDI